jgi:hypothetical protein
LHCNIKNKDNIINISWFVAWFSITTWGNEDTLHGKVLEFKMGLVKSNPRLGEKPSEAAATLGIAV